MRLSQLYVPTLREVPSDAEVVSHQLMLRAGMIRRVAAGIYTYLPLGVRVIKKIEQIIREEMNRAGAQEVLLPAVQPAELWIETGRWEEYGRELLRFRDRNERDFCFGPTHEEVITDLVRNEVRSYRQLPLNLYQIQTKFRDEIRPRFGLMRGREFIMKDAYSFDADQDGANASYESMRTAYDRIFHRCGLEFRAVDADTGAIGGRYSHEYMVLAETGEDVVVSCSHCDYAANLEKAELRAPDDAAPQLDESLFHAPEKVRTPNMRTVEEVTEFLHIQERRLIKTLIFSADDKPVAVLVRGDHEANEIKIRNALGASHIEMADARLVEEVSGAPAGFAGPIGLDVPIFADWAIGEMIDAVVGANEMDSHIRNANRGRDYHVTAFADLRAAQRGDLCPRCDGTLQFHRGIEVGHVFKLGTKYSERMGASFLDAEGNERFMVMGCYGIGVGRTAAAAIEQNHDENGIVWPLPIAPFQVYVLPIHPKDAQVTQASEALYRELQARGIETILDDRDERPGVKFKDADLMGIPYRVTVGPKNLKAGFLEVRFRKDGNTELVPVNDAVNMISDRLTEGLKHSL
ncbi:MAG: proline--tRNA ligase [Deltaproteobacteria bacterium]|nr:proline--tRNA ligase [Deltaproteobacteria bacterium]